MTRILSCDAHRIECFHVLGICGAESDLATQLRAAEDSVSVHVLAAARRHPALALLWSDVLCSGMAADVVHPPFDSGPVYLG